MEKNEVLSSQKILKLTGLKRRILLILNNNNSFLTSSKIHQLLMQSYRNGTIDKEYSFNYVCINLRELHSMELILRRESKHSFGRTSLYAINSYGREQLMNNLSKKSDNNSVVVERTQSYYKKEIVSYTKDTLDSQLLLSNSGG